MENCHRLFSEHCDPYRHFISPLSNHHPLPLPEPEIHTLTDNTHFHCLLLLDTPGIREKDIEKRGVDSRSRHTFCCGLVYCKYILTPLISPGDGHIYLYIPPLRFQCPKRKSFLDRGELYQVDINCYILQMIGASGGIVW